MRLRAFALSVLAASFVACAPAQPPMVTSPTTPTAAPAIDDGLDRLSSAELARRMFQDTGGAALAKQALDSMAASFRKMPGLPPGFIDRFLANADVNDLVDIVVPIYARECDRETMIAAIRFYESPQGRILTSKMPAMTEQSMIAGRAWGKAVAEKTIQQLHASPPGD
jgi:uncharacterized protein